jgi:serine/threonine-protein kinase RIO1
VTALAIQVRESRVHLPYTAGHRLVVEVPVKPLKVDRGTVVFPWLAGAAEHLMLKIYGEMGVFNWLRKQVVGYRARREFQTLDRLRSVGIPCCEPMFWGTGRSPVHGLFEMVATREIPGAQTMAERMPSLTPEARAEILGRVYEALARMHHAGIFHGAFYLTNVLLGSDPATANVPWLVDLEKSVSFAGDIRGSRMADFDLLCAVSSTFNVMGGGYARGALERYGLDEPEIARVFDIVRRSRSSKFNRYRRRAEFIARGVVSRLGA